AGRKFLGNPGAIRPVVSGWEFNGVYTAESGNPLFLSTASNLTNSSGGGSRPNSTGKSAKLSGNPRDRLTQWFDTSVLTQPPAFTFGNVTRTLPEDRKSTRLNSSH